MNIQDDLLAATAEHKIAMAVHAVMSSVSDIVRLDSLSEEDLDDLEISCNSLRRSIEISRMRRAA